MSLHYTIYLPSHTHDPLPIGAIDYRPAANQAVLQLDGSKEETFYSVAAAMSCVQRRYPTAFLEDGE
uniref:Uncharacterized protein n=1 Tax=Myoviridae sp. ctLYR7 TaxID=2827679 RepID=A0A8S5RXR3_9CAUD|nr:MAG TPA: hypothetical protein [Myoviridae sp. ctLYR7]